ncbi:hypothetical protein ZIOFF_002107 [Zingiber officinale]|uniref:WIBG Mago-binding domain-containing protein n=1 Tax=Zingiber officinale TaxID=94328 RepID=A0A8J5LSN9_ZINOF|nr:hypothetical protein ZIOFF_002107 [Zingiber officinale]
MGPMAKAGGAPPAIRLLSIPKEGERVLAPTRRPDGILRKPIRIRAGYVPQDEVAIYQSKGALLSKSSEATVPPGYDPDLAEKTKTKSARRNERKKEKRHQAALEKEKNMVSEGAEVVRTAKFVSADGTSQIEEFEAVTEHISRITLLAMPAIPEVSNSSAEPMEVSKTKSSGQDFDKKIPALKKKVNLFQSLDMALLSEVDLPFRCSWNFIGRFDSNCSTLIAVKATEPGECFMKRRNRAEVHILQMYLLAFTTLALTWVVEDEVEEFKLG